MKRSKHSLSNYKLLSTGMGYLTPIGSYEVLPGDTVQQSTSMLLRVAPMLAPVMHPVHAHIHHWYVPYRLLWEEFEDFITGGPDGTSTPTFPYISNTSFAEASIGDYLGIPAGITGNWSALPFRALNLIWNEWYRDQDLGTERTVDTGSGVDSTTTINTFPKVSWEKDYFTTSRPWTRS